MTVAHQTTPTVREPMVLVKLQLGGNLRLHRVPDQLPRPAAQNLRQRVLNSLWRGKANDSTLFHGVSLLLGDVEVQQTPTIRHPLLSVTPLSAIARKQYHDDYRCAVLLLLTNSWNH